MTLRNYCPHVVHYTMVYVKVYKEFYTMLERDIDLVSTLGPKQMALVWNGSYKSVEA